jgi:hypothetical protein
VEGYREEATEVALRQAELGKLGLIEKFYILD